MQGKAEVDSRPNKRRVRAWNAAELGARGLAGYLAGPVAIAFVTLCGFRLHLNLSTSGSLCFFAVILIAYVRGFWEASVTSLIAVTCLDYFFVAPVLTWRITSPQDLVALATFEATALAASRISTRLQTQAREQARLRSQAEKLYELSRRTLFLYRRQTVGPQIVRLIQEVFQTESVALFDAADARLDAAGPRASELEVFARNAYFSDAAVDRDGVSARVLRLGSKPAGGLALCAHDLDALTKEAIASLAAIALERARSFEKESRAEAGRQTEQLRTAVLDALAHAFKTPLTVILTATSGLLDAGNLSDEDAELATLIDEQAQNLNRLATELLQMARIDAAEVRLRPERAPVAALVEDALARRRSQLEGRSVRLTEKTPGVVVSGDRDILTTALEQFIDNASRYSAPDSPITIVIEENLAEAIISVHNEGPPIRSADLEKIFERFYRAEESRHRASGTGLGLSIARKAAEAHGGRTWVVSDEGAGTTFFFALPCGIRRRDDAAIWQGSDS